MKKLTVIASTLFLFGLFSIILKAFISEYVDSQGVLHEWFFLLPIGFGIIFIALCMFLVSLIASIVKNLKGNKI